MQTEKIHAEVDIKAPMEKVFEFVTNPNNIPLTLPGLIENTNVPDLPVKKGDKFNFKYKMLGVIIEGVVEVDEIQSPAIYSFSTSVGITSHWKEQLLEKDGLTNLVLDVEYETPESLFEKIKLDVAKQANQKDAEQFLQNIKLALELNS